VSAAYRVEQFIRAVAAWVRSTPVDEGMIGRYLPGAAVSLFQTMPRYDQQHALNVLGTLQEMGHEDRDLLAAALLHDVGKTAGQRGALRLWHRPAVVLMRAFWPGLLDHLGQDRQGSWRRPFFVQSHHAEIGAELARRAGCSPRTAELIRLHEDPLQVTDDPLRTALRLADSVN
jgi:putative nucleotidyltransferase with HDIG domain